MDERVVNWRPPETLLGLDPIYQLDRLSDRYSDISDEINEQRTVHALSDELALDVWSFARKFPVLTTMHSYRSKVFCLATVSKKVCQF
jgi:hypothetical protein